MSKQQGFNEYCHNCKLKVKETGGEVQCEKEKGEKKADGNYWIGKWKWCQDYLWEKA